MSTSTGSWRGDGERRLSAGALRWFREKVWEDLRNDAALRGTPLDPAVISELREPFLVDPMHWLVWVPDHGYRPGSHVAQGEWIPFKKYGPAITAAVDAALARQKEQGERDRLRPVVGKPLPEPDIEAALAELASDAEAPKETHAFRLLERSDYRKLDMAVNRIRRRFPIPCSCCHKPFTGKLSRAAIGPNDRTPRRAPEAGPTCPDCQAAHQRRCPGCHQVFTVTSHKQRRCPSCVCREVAS